MSTNDVTVLLGDENSHLSVIDSQYLSMKSMRSVFVNLVRNSSGRTSEMCANCAVDPIASVLSKVICCDVISQVLQCTVALSLKCGRMSVIFETCSESSQLSYWWVLDNIIDS